MAKLSYGSPSLVTFFGKVPIPKLSPFPLEESFTSVIIFLTPISSKGQTFSRFKVPTNCLLELNALCVLRQRVRSALHAIVISRYIPPLLRAQTKHCQLQPLCYGKGVSVFTTSHFLESCFVFLLS